MVFLWVLAISLSYFLGSLPSAHLVSNRKGFDPTRSGSGNPGATNVLRLVGRRAGVLVLLADFEKVMFEIFVYANFLKIVFQIL